MQQVLQTVIEVEKEIHRNIEDERKNAGGWLDKIRQSCHREIEDIRNQLTENHRTYVAQACEEAEERARERLNLVNCKIKALRNFPEDTLKKIIVAELSLLLPDQSKGTANDR